MCPRPRRPGAPTTVVDDVRPARRRHVELARARPARDVEGVAVSEPVGIVLTAMSPAMAERMLAGVPGEADDWAPDYPLADELDAVRAFLATQDGSAERATLRSLRDPRRRQRHRDRRHRVLRSSRRRRGGRDRLRDRPVDAPPRTWPPPPSAGSCGSRPSTARPSCERTRPRATSLRSACCVEPGWSSRTDPTRRSSSRRGCRARTPPHRRSPGNQGLPCRPCPLGSRRSARHPLTGLPTSTTTAPEQHGRGPDAARRAA